MKIKTALIGYGRNGSTMHADPVEKWDDFEMVAVCDIDPVAREKAGKRFDCPTYEDYHEMLEKEDIHFVIIVTLSHQHAQMATDCLNMGKDVVVTKPWAVNIDEVTMMVNASKKTGAKLLPWLPGYWASDLNMIKDVIAKGEIGTVFEINRSVYTFGKRNDWQTEKKCGGGYLLNWGPHLVFQCMELLNAPVKSVYGELKQRINPGDVEDNFKVTMKTDTGITANAEFSICASGLPDWVVKGDAGTIFVDGDKVTIHKANFPDAIDGDAYRGAVSFDIISKPQLLACEKYGDQSKIYTHIANVLRSETEYAVDLKKAINLTKILDAARTSSQINEVVHVDTE